MRIRPKWLVLTMVLTLLSPAPALADGHRAGIFGGVSFAEGSTLTGLNLAVDGPLPNHKSFGLVADYSFHKGTHDGIDVTRQLFVGGFSYTKKADWVVIGGHALIGGVWGDGSKNFIGTFGFDLDFIGAAKIMSNGQRLLVPQVRSDYSARSGSAPDFWRASAGFVYRWYKEPYKK